MSQAAPEPNVSRTGEPSSPSATPASTGPVLLQAARLRVGVTVTDTQETLSPEDLPPAPHEAASRLPVVEPKSYQIKGEVAQGGIGRILRARDERLDRPVALKELRAGAGLLAEDRFVREALLTARLQHPSIVPLYEAGRWPTGEPFYAMKYVAGRSLADVILATRTVEQRLGLLPHVLAVAEAMAYAHSERIIHRDLKPANVLVGDFGETVVIDWGLAKDLAEEQRASNAPADDDAPAPPSSSAPALTMHGAVMGTPAYMPLEQATGKRVDERADVYALGAILYHLLAGTCPYDGDTSANILRKVIAAPPLPLEERQKGLPQDLIAIVKKAMARDAANRYPSAKELADDLRRFQTGQIVGAHTYSRRERLRRFLRRHRGAVAACASALVVLMITGAIAAHHNITQRARAEMGEAAALAAQKEAVEHADDLTLVQARAAASRDPNEALVWLKSLSPSFDRWPEARLIAADAAARGVALVLRGHTAGVNDVSFSPDGRLLASASDDHAARLWDVQTGQSRLLAGHSDEAWMSRFSPSGALLATASKDRTIRLWDTQTGAPLRVLVGHTREVSSIVFCDEDTLLSADLSRAVWRWDLRTGAGRLVLQHGLFRGSPLSADRRRAALFGEDGALYLYAIDSDKLEPIAAPQPDLVAVALSPDGAAVFGRSKDGSVRRWDVATGKPQILLRQRGSVEALRQGFAFSPSGEQLAMAGEGPILRLWDVPTGAARVLDDQAGKLTIVAFSPDGALLAAGSYDHTVHLWDLARGQSSVMRGFDDVVSTVAFSSNGERLAATGTDHTVRVFPLTTRSHQIALDHGSSLRTVAFSPDGARVVTGGSDGAALLVDLGAQKSTPLLGHVSRVRRAIFSPGGDLVATTDIDGVTRVWDLEGHEIWAMDGGPDPLFWGQVARPIAGAPVFSPDGRLLAVPGKGAAVHLLNVDSGLQRSLAGHVASAQCVAFSPDGKLLASSDAEGRIVVWDLASEAPRVFSGHQVRAISLAFSPDSRVLASGSEDHTFRLWDVQSGEARSFDAGGFGIAQIAFTSDGAAILTRDLEETGVRVWSAATGEILGSLRGHSGGVRDFALSPDDRRVATASADGTARLWDLKSGQSRVLSGHKGELWSTAFSPDGTRVVTAGEDGTVRLWADDLPEDGPRLRAFLAAATPDTIDVYRHSARTPVAPSGRAPGR